jgi:hypothetical protein
MKSPWQHLPKRPPFVIKQDEAAIRAFNKAARPQYQIRLEQLPEPFLGNPESPVVLLNLNPGYDEEETEQHHHNPHFIETSWNNLLHRPSAYRFHLLDPENSASLGYAWWNKRLRVLIEGCGLKVVANNVLCVEYFPYHSERFGFREILHSQRYSFHLVRQAMKRNAVIVLMRSRRLWWDIIPELADYTRCHALSNPQATYVTPNNCRTGYEEIVKALT